MLAASRWPGQLSRWFAAAAVALAALRADNSAGMSFPLGRPILVMILLAGALGAWRAIEPRPASQGLALWVFADPQRVCYERLRLDPRAAEIPPFHVELIPSRAIDARLSVLMLSHQSTAESPDAVEVEITSLGRYLRPSPADIEFLPLNRYLEGATGPRWIDQLLASRVAPATKEGMIFAIPHDVHPVALAFRHDLFHEAGADLIDADGRSMAPTWRDLQQKCVAFQRYWRARGYRTRHAMRLPQANAEVLLPMLLQQHIELIDANGRIRLNEPVVARTMADYVGMVVGADAIGDDSAANSAMEYADLAEGNVCALLMPDWKLAYAKELAPQLAGKLRLIPLPRFAADDEPTVSYGGTYVAIPRTSRHPDEAWKMIQWLYFSPAALARRRELGILPPIWREWEKPEYHQPDPFLGGQKGLELYASLAPHVPPTSSSPVNSLAAGTLNFVLSATVNQAQAEGNHDLVAQCQRRLDAAAADLQRRIDQSRVAAGRQFVEPQTERRTMKHDGYEG